MPRVHVAFAIACILGPGLVGSGASAQSTEAHKHPDVVVDSKSWRVQRSARADFPLRGATGPISTTADNQLLVELTPDDTAPANLFDLDGRTVVFSPDGHGGYSRAVLSVAWEDDLGAAVADGAEIEIESFGFDFAGRRWGSFFVSRHGLITFGEPFSYSYWDSENRFDTMSEIAGKFAMAPTVSPLYKPMLGGRSDRYGATQHVVHHPDRVVVTWTTTEPDYYVYGLPPAKPSRFQVVLGADGSIAFNYTDVTLGDGIVGLFPDVDPVKGAPLVSIADGRSSELPGHLDLLNASVYATDTEALILEFTLRDRVPDPPAGELYSYRLHFDADAPFWSHPVDWSDEDFTWMVDVRSGGERLARGQGVVRLLPGDAANRIAILVDIGGADISATAFAASAHFVDDRGIRGDDSRMELVELSAGAASGTDLSRPDGAFATHQTEVFHYRSPPDPVAVACRVIGARGDGFDLFVFHSEFRIDSQESGTPVRPHYGSSRAEGTGIPWDFGVPCGDGRLKAVWELPVWMQSDHIVNRDTYLDDKTRWDRGLLLFAHEFTHAWTAHASHDRDGAREPLHGNYCRCHWRRDLHAPAAFPWHEKEPGPRSLMGGRYWRDNGDGTFTPLDGYWGGGHSWLDLYLAGLADASEVPDTFILRNLEPVRAGDEFGPHTGEQEWVSIEQVIAAEGLRKPSPEQAQSVFNAAFVYLLEPGRAPDPDMLRLHAEYRDKVLEHWFHITGGRSRMTTVVPDSPAVSGVAVGTLPGAP